MNPPIQPGLVVLHGNRLELLRDAIFDWLARTPLDPLEEEIFLVQSNGAAEWLKMELARSAGVCAAMRVELPGRFLWRTYRQMLGRPVVPAQSALEKSALTWRLMRLLAALDGAVFDSVARFLQGGDLERRLQLARRLADLYDQYQVYRNDWLAAWAGGRDVLLDLDGHARPLPPDQRWQAALWRAILAELTREEKRSTRAYVHDAFMRALADGAAPAAPLPRRVVLFGASHLSLQALEALAAMAGHTQVMLAIPNPSRFHWADIIEGREAWRTTSPRHPSSTAEPLAHVPLDAMHLHAHPLLAAWGRQGRDFMQMLERFDDVEATRRQFDIPRIDLFDEGSGATLLQQVQSSIRDLVPLAEHPAREVPRADRSIVFHVAHGAQREVEILHDQLLATFAEGALGPRGVVVMVPDVEVFAPAIRAVFGQYPRDDARFIPFDIADLQSRGSDPLLVAVEWLLRIPEKRAQLAEIRDLLDVPAIARRIDLDPASLPQLFAWLAGAGVRWGLDANHRERLGLGACGEQNSWRFGFRRMLLGYATGDDEAFAGVEPYGEIGGLDAALLGTLAEFLERIETWWEQAGADATPREWAARGRALLDTFVAATDERERLTVVALQSALAAWLESCELARFDERVPLAIVREALLAGVDGLDASRRFLTGGVTFCTLLPLRAVPFEMVCLLGMNDGAYPRASRRSDFDLMAMPGQQRPGDRARRDDDRYLMLEALLSARQTLYVSWSGRNPRDNSAEPPSVLVAQLRDYLAAGWSGEAGGDVLEQRTTGHPLQPFSRRYFERGGLFTYAREWRAAHGAAADAASSTAPAIEAGKVALDVRQLVRFLKNPVKQYFRMRLGVVHAEDDAAAGDDETFVLSPLDQYHAIGALLKDPADAARRGIDAAIDARRQRMLGSGSLPLFESGTRVAKDLGDLAGPMLARWSEFHRRWSTDAAKVPLRFVDGDLIVDDWLDGLRSDGATHARLELTASRLLEKSGAVRPDKLIGSWVAMLLAGACGHRVPVLLIGRDAVLCMRPLDTERACALMHDLVDAWREGMNEPLPFAAKTALALVGDTVRPEQTYHGSRAGNRAEREEFCLSRLYHDFDALSEDGRFETYAARLFAPVHAWTLHSVTIIAAGEPLTVGPQETGA